MKRSDGGLPAKGSQAKRRENNSVSFLSRIGTFEMDFDDVLEDLGDFGTYQKMIIYLVLLPAVIPCSFHAYNQIFISAKPDHWCRVPELENRNLSLEFIKNLSIPLKAVSGLESYEECVYYEKNYSGVVGFETAEKVPCQKGWHYDTSKFTSTVVTEWNLVCENDFYPTLALVLFGVGGSIGNFVFGYIQDTWGRKIAFFVYLLIETIFGVGSAFATNFPFWMILRFGVGFTVPAILESPYVLAVELVGPKKRAYCTILINIAYSMGLVILSGVFYLVRDWRQLTLVTTIPFVYLFSYWWVMPESPRWLFAKGRFEECTAFLNKMADTMGKKLPANYLVDFEKRYLEEKAAEDKEKHYGVRDLFKLPNLRRKTILITLIWSTNTAVYVGLSYYAPVLGNDEFFNFFLAGAVELPTYIFLWPAMEKFGRRWTLCLSMVTGGFACLATFLAENRETITFGLYCLGKMSISCSFVVLPLMASELYPTVVRGIGISFSSVVGQIGPIFIPLINYLGKDWMVLPLMIMGGLLVFGGVLSMILPETLHQHLPQTLQEADMFGKKTPWKLRRFKRKIISDESRGNTKSSEENSKDSNLCNSKLVLARFDSKEVQTV